MADFRRGTVLTAGDVSKACDNVKSPCGLIAAVRVIFAYYRCWWHFIGRGISVQDGLLCSINQEMFIT